MAFATGQCLSTRKSAVVEALDTLRARRPAGRDPDEVVAMLDAVPDLRPALNAASDEELVEIFRAFDLTITYDKLLRFVVLGPDRRPDR
jgi:hypothetical protein